MCSTENCNSHLKWRNTWFRLENKIESQVILVQTKTKGVVRKGPLQMLGSFNVNPFLYMFVCIAEYLYIRTDFTTGRESEKLDTQFTAKYSTTDFWENPTVAVNKILDPRHCSSDGEKNRLVASHTNEFYHIWTSHVTYEWVTSHVKKMRDPRLRSSDGEKKRLVASHTNEFYHIWMSHGTYEWVTSHVDKNTLTRDIARLLVRKIK